MVRFELLRAWGYGATDVQEGRAVGAGPIVESLERICAHESKPGVHALALNGGSATLMSIL